MSDKEIPKDWKRVRVDSIARLYRGINYTKDVVRDSPSINNLPVLRGNNINVNLNYDDLVYVPKELIKPEQLIQKDDIIFAMSSGSKHLVGKSAVAKTNFNGSYGAFCALLRIDNGVNKKYISLVFRGNGFRKLISEIAKGTNINNLKREHILGFELLLPPFETQHAIVSKIEELFSELDKGIENLKTAQAQLKVYRQSVLKWAFEGKLTSTSTIWNHKMFKDCLKFSQGIQVDVNLQSLENKEGYVRFLRIIDFTQGKDEHRFIANPGEKYYIEKDEVALVRYGATTGFVCNGKEGVIANNLFKVMPTDKILNQYLFYFLKSTSFQNVVAQNIKGAAMPAISFGLINNVILPFPSIEEQTQIVQEIESRLSVADKMEETIQQSLLQAESLRQSILKKAFEGGLVK